MFTRQFTVCAHLPRQLASSFIIRPRKQEARQSLSAIRVFTIYNDTAQEEGLAYNPAPSPLPFFIPHPLFLFCLTRHRLFLEWATTEHGLNVEQIIARYGLEPIDGGWGGGCRVGLTVLRSPHKYLNYFIICFIPIRFCLNLFSEIRRPILVSTNLPDFSLLFIYLEKF